MTRPKHVAGLAVALMLAAAAAGRPAAQSRPSTGSGRPERVEGRRRSPRIN